MGGDEEKDNGHLGELRRAAQERIKKGLFSVAEATKAELDRLGGQIAQALNCVLLTAPLKGMDRASVKVANDYEGHWLELKDVARITLVCEASRMDETVSVLKELFKPVHGYSTVKDTPVPPDEPCGYSGHNFVMQFGMNWPQNDALAAILARRAGASVSGARPNARPHTLTHIKMESHQIIAALDKSMPPFAGRMGEIQVNTVPMMFGKMSRPSFLKNFGALAYLQHQGRFRVEGGAGHLLYEVYRVAPNSAQGKAAAALSKRYYRRLRMEDPLPAGKDTLKADLLEFMAGLPPHMLH